MTTAKETVIARHPNAYVLELPGAIVGRKREPSTFVLRNAFGSHEGPTRAEVWRNAAESLLPADSPPPRATPADTHRDKFEALHRDAMDDTSSLGGILADLIKVLMEQERNQRP